MFQMPMHTQALKNKLLFILSYFPKAHMIAACTLGMALIITLSISNKEAKADHQYKEIALKINTDQKVSTNTVQYMQQKATEAPSTSYSAPQTIKSTNTEQLKQTLSNTTPKAPTHTSLASTESSFNLAAPLTVKKIKVKSGDSLSTLFKRAGLNDKLMMSWLKSCKECNAFTKLFPGYSFEFSLDENNTLSQLRYIKSKLKELQYTRTNESYQFEEITRKTDIYSASRSGKITSNFFEAAKKSDLNDNLVMAFANIFGWDIDFALDLRKGDTFNVVYEEHFLDGEKIKNGKILAAEFINQGEVFRAVGYEDLKGNYNYFTPEGKSMRKAFLRAPLDFRRISSHFNPRRVHPVFKTIRPHRGIDYAAKTGTPIWSPGDGRVIASGFTKPNGNYIVIQHGNNIQTKYLHLHKRYVKKGQKVKQKQKIGSVGSTGYSTGPHLHYEFLIDGVHRNPRTVLNKLPKTASIKSSELARFKQSTQNWLAELDKNNKNIQIALSDGQATDIQ